MSEAAVEGDLDLKQVTLHYPSGDQETLDVEDSYMVTGEGPPFIIIVLGVGETDESQGDSRAVSEGQ